MPPPANQYIKLPDGSYAAFPSTMSDEDIQGALVKGGLVQKPEGYIDTVEDRLIGAGKRVMRAGQQIGNIPKVFGLPGLAEGTDKAFGLAPGTSWNLSEPSNPAQKVGGEYGMQLATMAATGAEGADTETAGRAIEDQGTKLQTAMDSVNRKAVKSGGAFGYVMRGHPLQAVYAGMARLGANLSAQGLESLGQTLSADPDAAGKLATIVEKATAPGSPVSLTGWQSKFLSSVSDQLNAGKTLSGLQKQYVNIIYRSLGQ